MARKQDEEFLYRRPENHLEAQEAPEKKEEASKAPRQGRFSHSSRDAGEVPAGWKKAVTRDPIEKAADAQTDGENADAPDAAEPARSGENAESGGEKKPEAAAEKTAKRPAARHSAAKGKTDDEKRGFVKRMIIFGMVAVLFLGVAMMVVSNFVDAPILGAPKKIVTAIIAPVQKAFSGVTDSVVSYLRALKVRGNIEYEYEQLLKQIDDLASEAAMAEEYKRQVNELYDLMDEMNRNTDLNPLAADVIGHDTGNYFSVLTINVGSSQGVKDYMAVVYGGGLVGYTYDVKENSSSVRCVIDSDATVSAMVQSSRDQGAVKGTLGIDGNPRCRMYYLPETSLPRPGDVVVTSGVGLEFPKGIPIGTVRESTRGMDDNKSYIVVEPIVDFQHLEYVVVYRYQPSYAESAQDRTADSSATLEPLTTARPQPTFQVGADTSFTTATPDPNATDTPVPTDTPAPTEVPTPSPTPDPNATPVPANLSYQAPDNLNGTNTPAPTASPSPTPSPTPTFDPGSMTVEEDP